MNQNFNTVCFWKLLNRKFTLNIINYQVPLISAIQPDFLCIWSVSLVLMLLWSYQQEFWGELPYETDGEAHLAYGTQGGGDPGFFLGGGAPLMNDVTDRWCKQMLQILAILKLCKPSQGGAHPLYPPPGSPLGTGVNFGYLVSLRVF